MRVNLNGRPHDLPDGTSVTSLVSEVAGDPRGIAVAVNGTVVRAGDWSVTTLRDRDVVEVVSAHQGG